MLPLILSEEKLFVFKFWFNQTLQEGMSYRGELFWRIRTFALCYRPQVYQQSCKLAKKGAIIIITTTQDTCSLWLSLREPDMPTLLTEIDHWNLPYLEYSFLKTSHGPPSEAEPF